MNIDEEIVDQDMVDQDMEAMETIEDEELAEPDEQSEIVAEADLRTRETPSPASGKKNG